MSNEQLWQAVENDDVDLVKRLVKQGVSVNTRHSSGLTPLLLACGHGNAEIVRLLLDAGADIFTVDTRAGISTLHKACQGGNIEVVRMLVAAGAFIDSVAPTTGHTPLMDAFWYKWPDIVQYLLSEGASLNLHTHYGFSFGEHIAYQEKVNFIGQEKIREAKKMLEERQQADERKKQNQKLMAAVNNNDIATVQQLIKEGVNVEERYPILNGFNDAHTPLLVAARDGYIAIAQELLKAGADVNAVEPVFGAVPLHKSVYNGHEEITRILVQQPKINLDFQGATNGYTPLHDAIWHGYSECAEILVSAGARLDLKGDDGKTPLTLALDIFGAESAIVELIEFKLKATKAGKG